MSLGLSFTSDVIPFDQNWHHLYSTSAGGKHVSNDAQIKKRKREKGKAKKIQKSKSLKT